MGNYASYRHSYLSNCLDYFQNNSYTKGESIEINSDSTFVYKNCSMIMNGNWKVKNDSLLLYFSKKTFIIDSLNYSEKYKYATRTSSEPLVFIIKNSSLSIKRKTSNGRSIYTDMKKK